MRRWQERSSWFVSILMTSHVLLSCPRVRQLAPLAARAPNLSCSSVIFYWSSPDSGLFHRGVSFDSASSPFKFSWRQRNCWREFCQPEMTVELLSESELSECLGCDRAGCELWSATRSVQFLWTVFSPSYRGEGCAKVKLFCVNSVTSFIVSVSDHSIRNFRLESNLPELINSRLWSGSARV